MRVALVDAGGANLGSVRFALERLGVRPVLVRDAAALESADRVVLPGVSTAGTVMQRLRELDLVEPLRQSRKPLLGVCVGMQLLYESSEEGDVECLGLIKGRVRKLAATPGVRVPHMGWNTLQRRRDASLVDGVEADRRAYFVHSYAAPVGDESLLTTTHGGAFSAVVQRGHVAGAQFHPERSGTVGARLLGNFLAHGLA